MPSMGCWPSRSRYTPEERILFFCFTLVCSVLCYTLWSATLVLHSIGGSHWQDTKTPVKFYSVEYHSSLGKKHTQKRAQL